MDPSWSKRWTADPMLLYACQSSCCSREGKHSTMDTRSIRMPQGTELVGRRLPIVPPSVRRRFPLSLARHKPSGRVRKSEADFNWLLRLAGRSVNGRQHRQHSHRTVPAQQGSGGLRSLYARASQNGGALIVELKILVLYSHIIDAAAKTGYLSQL